MPGPGKSAYELLDSLGRPDADGSSGVRALLVMGSNVVVSAPNVINIEERLKSLDFLVVSDFSCRDGGIGRRRAAVGAVGRGRGDDDKPGGRVIRRRRAFAPPAGVQDDVTTICKLAWLLGKGNHFDYADTTEIFAELGQASAGGPADYSGITYEKIEANNGVFWPCPGSDHPGTPRMFTDAFPTASGKARFHPVRHAAPAEEPDAEYPCI